MSTNYRQSSIMIQASQAKLVRVSSFKHAELIKLRSEVRVLGHQYDDARKGFANSHLALEDAQKQLVEHLRGQNDQLQKRVEELERQSRDLAAQRDDCEQEKQRLKEQVEELRVRSESGVLFAHHAHS